MQNGWGRAWREQHCTDFAVQFVQVNGETARGIEVAEKLARSTGQASIDGFVSTCVQAVYIGIIGGMETVKKWRHVDLADLLHSLRGTSIGTVYATMDQVEILVERPHEIRIPIQAFAQPWLAFPASNATKKVQLGVHSTFVPQRSSLT